MAKNITSKTYKIGGYSLTRTKETDTNNYQNNMAATVYGNKNKAITTRKSTILTTPKSMRTKVVDYDPISYYGKQDKTVSKVYRKK